MKIESVYTLKQPLSHIGESESTTSFLNTIRVMNGGKVCDVFAYTGNALRGAFRDAGAVYLLEKLGEKASNKMFHILFSGGFLSGEQKYDTEQAREIRSLFPIISLLGAGIGNQILCGKISQSFALPVCAETSNIIPENITGIDYSAKETSWKMMTGTIQLSRKDDEKDVRLSKYTSDAEEKEITQMRYEVEYLVPNAQLYHTMSLNCNDMELGAYVSCIKQWAHTSVLGGMSGRGFGMVDVNMIANGERFVTVENCEITLSQTAEQALCLYDEFVEENKDAIIAMLEK